MSAQAIADVVQGVHRFTKRLSGWVCRVSVFDFPSELGCAVCDVLRVGRRVEHKNSEDEESQKAREDADQRDRLALIGQLQGAAWYAALN